MTYSANSVLNVWYLSIICENGLYFVAKGDIKDRDDVLISDFGMRRYGDTHISALLLNLLDRFVKIRQTDSFAINGVFASAGDADIRRLLSDAGRYP